MNATRRRSWLGAEARAGLAGFAQISKGKSIELSSSKQSLKRYSRGEKLGRVPTTRASTIALPNRVSSRGWSQSSANSYARSGTHPATAEHLTHQINKPMTLRRLIRQLDHFFCKSNNRVAMGVRHG